MIEIIALRVDGVDKAHLPAPSPMLDRFFALDRVANIVKVLEINQSFQPAAFGESLNNSLSMFKDASGQMTCDADVQDAVAMIGHEIDPATRHFQIKARRGWPGQARP